MISTWLGIQDLCQRAARVASRGRSDFLRRAHRDDLPACFTTFRPQIDYVVCGLDDQLAYSENSLVYPN